MREIRERALMNGPQVLGNAELLSILVDIRGGDKLAICRKILIDCGGLPGIHKKTAKEIHLTTGISEGNALRIKAAVDLGRRLATTTEDSRQVIHSPEDAADLLMYEMGALDQEELRVILLNTRNHVLGIKTIYRGSTNASMVRSAEVLKPAVRENAVAIIVAHNHPSGDPSPSPDDVAITKVFIEAGKLLDIQVLDHIIIGQGRFVSLNRRGLGFDGGL